jgi:hypothetical protein
MMCLAIRLAPFLSWHGNLLQHETVGRAGSFQRPRFPAHCPAPPNS